MAVGSVRQLNPKDPKSPWVYEYTDPHTRKRTRVTPKSGKKTDARAMQSRIAAEMFSGTHVTAAADMTVAKVAEMFLEHARQRQLDGKIGKARFRNLEINVRKAILPHFGTMKLTEISLPKLEAWYKHMRQVEGKSLLSVKARYFDFRMIEDFAVSRKLAFKTPVKDGWKEIGGGKETPIRTFTTDEVGKVLSAAGVIRYKGQTRSAFLRACYVYLAAFAGLRFGEIGGLTLANVDLERRVIRVRHSMSVLDGLKGPKTKAGVRDVPMCQELHGMLSAWIEEHMVANDAGLVFIHNSGKTIDNRSFHKAHWRPLLKWAGLGEERIHFHALRHYFSSAAIKSGIYSLMEVASLLGHNTYDTTLQVYAHPIAGGQNRPAEMDRLSGLVAPRDTPMLLSATKTRRIDVSPS